MKKSTHAIVSVLAGIIFLPWLSVEGWRWWLALAACYFAGISNDVLDFTVFAMLDHRNNITHNLSSPLALFIGYGGYVVGAFISPAMAVPFGFLIGGLFELHTALDAFNPTGIFLTFSKHVKGTIHSDSFWLNAVTVACASMVCMAWWGWA